MFNRCFVQSASSRGRNEVIPGTKKKTSIPFCTFNARKIKRERSWKSHPAKSNLVFWQCWPLAIQNLIFGATEVQLMQTWFCWIPNAKKYQRSNFSQKWCHMREIWFFKDDNWILPANRFREETSPNYILKHLNRHPSFYISNLAPLSQSLKISCKAISLF